VADVAKFYTRKLHVALCAISVRALKNKATIFLCSLRVIMYLIQELTCNLIHNVFKHVVNDRINEQ